MYSSFRSRSGNPETRRRTTGFAELAEQIVHRGFVCRDRRLPPLAPGQLPSIPGVSVFGSTLCASTSALSQPIVGRRPAAPRGGRDAIFVKLVRKFHFADVRDMWTNLQTS